MSTAWGDLDGKVCKAFDEKPKKFEGVAAPRRYPYLFLMCASCITVSNDLKLEWSHTRVLHGCAEPSDVAGGLTNTSSALKHFQSVGACSAVFSMIFWNGVR